MRRQIHKQGSNFAPRAVRWLHLEFLIWKNIELPSKFDSLLKPVPHGLHLFTLCRVDVQLMLGEFFQGRVLVLHGHLALTPNTLIEQICFEEPFKFHDHRR